MTVRFLEGDLQDCSPYRHRHRPSRSIRDPRQSVVSGATFRTSKREHRYQRSRGLVGVASQF